MSRLPEDPNHKNTDQGSPPKKRKDFSRRILDLMRVDKSKTGGYYTPTSAKSEPADSARSSPKPTKPKP